MSAVTHQMAPGFFFFQRGWLNGNHFAFLGARNILIDSAYLGGQGETLALLASVGLEPEAVNDILTTHVHCDHVGAHAAIARRSGCSVALHERCRAVIGRKDGRATWHRFYVQEYEYFPTHRSLAHGQRLNLNGLEFICLHVPGHAAGQLAFFAPDTGWLISADAVWESDFGVLTLQVEGWDAPFRQRESLEMLAKLQVGTIYPGHGAPIDDGRAALEACLERTAAFIEKPLRMGQDQMRKILLYQTMMHQPLSRQELWAMVGNQPWFGETCALYFGGSPQDATFNRYLDELLERGLLSTYEGLMQSTLEA